MWTARVLSALQLGPSRHLSPSASVIGAAATVQQAAPLNPSLIAAPEQERVLSSQRGLDSVTWQDSSLIGPNSSSSYDPL